MEFNLSPCLYWAGSTGLEPAISGLTGRILRFSFIYLIYLKHPLIVIASNAHASYFHGDLVYRVVVNPFGIYVFDDYKDEVDYILDGNTEYFNYDYLEKLGETGDKSPYSIHGYSYPTHAILPPGNSKEWLGFPGRVGKSWQFSAQDLQSIGLHFLLTVGATFEFVGYDLPSIHVQTPAPFTPSFSWEYYSFTNDISGFGNESDNRKTITWESIWP